MNCILKMAVKLLQYVQRITLHENCYITAWNTALYAEMSLVKIKKMLWKTMPGF